ncbi:hypothetical protein [Ancylomarina sp.]|uniref:hypothetical protein n=1 Tax=Ancylomarina sp. TaxID=1970196 RepID=UPI003569FD32
MRRQTLHKEIVGIQELESFDAFQYFEKRLSRVLETHLFESSPVHLLSQEEKQLIFGLLWYVRSPKRAPENAISDSDLKSIGEEYHQIIHKFRISHEGKEIALLDYNILAAFYHVLYHGIKSRKRTRYLKENFAIPILEGASLLKSVPNMYTACFFMLISRLNDIRKQCYSFKMLHSDGQGNLNMTLTPVLSIYWARQESMMIHRAFRSVYKVPNPQISSGINWLKISKEKLESHYSGNKSELNLYIQTHALNQIQERLDIFDQQALNDILSFSLRHIKAFEIYKGNLLLPILVCHIKVGYLVCDIIDDRLVARTFRFITQNKTPVGDSLLENHIHSKFGITYCPIDKLRLLFKVEDEVVLNLYYDAGVEDVFCLKNYNLIIDAMQEANYKEFLSYIKQGEEAELNVTSVNREDLNLQDYSLVKLLGLLILNTIGLIVAQVMKMFYSLASTFKGLGKQNADLNEKFDKRRIIGLSNAKLLLRNELDVVHAKSEKYEEQVS